MESKVNYAIVGAFVILFGIAGIGIVLWIVGGGSSNAKYKEYIICTDTGVNGLNRDSAVKYKGLLVGKVVNIKISKIDPEYIEIYALIRRDLPVDDHTFARISSNGLTGIAYVNLFRSKEKKYKCPSEFKKLPYPTIPAVESSLTSIMNKLPRVVDKIGSIAESINSMLDKNTQKNFKKLLKNLAETSSELKKSVTKIDGFIYKADNLTHELSLDAVLLQRSLKSINELLSETKGDLRDLNETTLKESYETMKNINSTVIQMKQLIEEIRENPSLLIRGRK